MAELALTFSDLFSKSSKDFLDINKTFAISEIPMFLSFQSIRIPCHFLLFQGKPHPRARKDVLC